MKLEEHVRAILSQAVGTDWDQMSIEDAREFVDENTKDIMTRVKRREYSKYHRPRIVSIRA